MQFLLSSNLRFIHVHTKSGSLEVSSSEETEKRKTLSPGEIVDSVDLD